MFVDVDATVTVDFVLTPVATRIYIDPSTSVANPGESFSIDVRIADASGVAAWEVSLGFDPEILSTNTAMITEGTFLSSFGLTSFSKSYDPFTGATFGAFFLEDVTASGDGILATVQIEVVGTGQSALDLYGTSLLDSDLIPIAHSVEDGEFYTDYPRAVFTYEPAEPIVGQEVSFDASGSYDPYGSITSYDWDFGDGETGTGVTTAYTYTAADTYSVTLTVTDDEGLTDTETHIILVAIHDVAITEVTASPSVVAPGDLVSISVTVENQGTETEVFDVTVYFDDTVIDTEVGVLLSAGDSEVLMFSWDTSGVDPGMYTISAEASEVPNETDIEDNKYEDSTVEVTSVEDTTPPTITITEPIATDYLHSENLTISFTVVDLESGVASEAATLDGASVANGDTVVLYYLSLGEHTFTVTAIDNAGNTATETVTFNVIATVQSLQDLVELFFEAGYIDPPQSRRRYGIPNSLLVKLYAAEAYIGEDEIDDAIGVLGAFMNHVKAQSGRHITEFAANILIADAQFVIDQLQ